MQDRSAANKIITIGRMTIANYRLKTILQVQHKSILIIVFTRLAGGAGDIVVAGPGEQVLGERIGEADSGAKAVHRIRLAAALDHMFKEKRGFHGELFKYAPRGVQPGIIRVDGSGINAQL